MRTQGSPLGEHTAYLLFALISVRVGFGCLLSSSITCSRNLRGFCRQPWYHVKVGARTTTHEVSQLTVLTRSISSACVARKSVFTSFNDGVRRIAIPQSPFVTLRRFRLECQSSDGAVDSTRVGFCIGGVCVASHIHYRIGKPGNGSIVVHN